MPDCTGARYAKLRRSAAVRSRSTSIAAEEDHRTTIDWDANEEALVGWLSIGGKRTRVSATVDIIHQHAAGFNDAVIYEIKKHKQERFEKLVPYFLKADASQ